MKVDTPATVKSLPTNKFPPVVVIPPSDARVAIPVTLRFSAIKSPSTVSLLVKIPS